jgi:hypothetical protein
MSEPLTDREAALLAACETFIRQADYCLGQLEDGLTSEVIDILRAISGEYPLYGKEITVAWKAVEEARSRAQPGLPIQSRSIGPD